MIISSKSFPKTSLHPCNPKKLKSIKGEGFTDLFSDALEEVNEKDLNIVGDIPEWLDGILIRNGPSLFGTTGDKAPSRKYDHIFDGLAKLHSFKINNKKVIDFSIKKKLVTTILNLSCLYYD